MQEDPAVSRPILIAGGGTLAAAIDRALRAANAPVARLHPGDIEDGELGFEPIEHVSVLVLAADNDSGNVDLALQARRMRADLPLVVRLFDTALASYLAETLPGVTVLSPSGVAAPVFVEAARRVLAHPPLDNPARERFRRLHSRPRPFKMDPFLMWALVLLFALVFPSALMFTEALGLRYMDALYFVWTTVMTVGYGDITLKDAPDGLKLFGMGLMLAGPGFIAVLFALLSDWVISRRLDVLRGRTRERGSGHVLIAGAGDVGVRVAELLAGNGRRLVIIERDPNGRNVPALSAAGHHVIIADATSEEMLLLAGLDAAAVVLAVTDSDAVNLQIALHARDAGVPAIIRAVSPELSAHVSDRGDGIALTPLAAVTESFAQAALSAAAAARKAAQG